jgi:hypothetical protein
MMSEQQHFVIQGEDGKWYTGASDAGTPLWNQDVRLALLFAVYVEALETVNGLHDAGYQVRLFGVSPDIRGGCGGVEDLE